MDKKFKINIKDAIAQGDLNYFEKYCLKRHEMGIVGRKENKNEKLHLDSENSDIIFANTNLLYQICSSQHKNSKTMLEILINNYCGHRDYALKNYGHQFILKIFDERKARNGDKKLAVNKLYILLDNLERLQLYNISLDCMKEILEKKLMILDFLL